MIGYLNGVPYCRKCISFKGEEADNSLNYPKRASFHLSYQLSEDQLKLSNQLISNYKRGINSLVHAVCGSGKTEIVLAVIQYSIQCGEHVGFAVPRRDVCIELRDRFKSIFKRNKVGLVCGGNTDDLYGDLICLTTHQLYRYDHYFDLLIIDEVDAFPFKDNEILEAFFYKSIKSRYIMMSATPDEKLLKKFSGENMDILNLNTRFHGHPLPVPELISGNKVSIYLLLFKTLRKFKNLKKQAFIFCPTISICENTYYIYKFLFKNCDFVHSKKQTRSETIQAFRERKIQFLFTTAVLERGVTVKDLQVVVFMADHSVYTQYSLVQIAGRVGRKADAPEGEVIFIGKEINESMAKAREDIISANESLQNVF
ncbi:MAG: DEAD/DEAH box helicase family protein [Bacilli bacterium]|nr:DEAD/DEAH box helicase family protein [Bacilli bacterium]